DLGGRNNSLRALHLRSNLAWTSQGWKSRTGYQTGCCIPYDPSLASFSARWKTFPLFSAASFRSHSGARRLLCLEFGWWVSKAAAAFRCFGVLFVWLFVVLPGRKPAGAAF